jgi:hypothetical protein
VPHVNTRFPDDLYEQVTAAANAEERPIGSWLRIAAKEKLARDTHGQLPGKSRIAGPVPTTNNVSPDVEESLRDLSQEIAEQTRQELPKHLERNSVEPRFKKGGKK